MLKVTLENKVRLVYEEFGSISDPLILLISGAGAPAEFWPGSFCEKLALEGLRVVRYLHRDTGLSTHFDTRYDIIELLIDLKSLVQHLGGEQVHVVGHSMGGFLAQLAICEFPDRLTSATSISAGSAVSDQMHTELGTSTPYPEVWDVLMKNLPKGNFNDDLPGWLESWQFLNANRQFDVSLATRYTQALYTGNPRNAQVAENHIHAMTTIPDTLVSRLPGSQTPLLVLHGTDDPLVPIDNGQATSRLAKHGVFKSLDGAGHMFFNLDTWNEISGYLQSHVTASGSFC